MQPPSPSPAASGSSTTAPTPSGYASDDDDDFLGNDDDSLDGVGGGGIDEADDEDRIPEELLLKYANEAGIDKGKYALNAVSHWSSMCFHSRTFPHPYALHLLIHSVSIHLPVSESDGDLMEKAATDE